jgi:hypothetical protein
MSTTPIKYKYTVDMERCLESDPCQHDVSHVDEDGKTKSYLMDGFDIISLIRKQKVAPSPALLEHFGDYADGLNEEEEGDDDEEIGQQE